MRCQLYLSEPLELARGSRHQSTFGLKSLLVDRQTTDKPACLEMRLNIPSKSNCIISVPTESHDGTLPATPQTMLVHGRLAVVSHHVKIVLWGGELSPNSRLQLFLRYHIFSLSLGT